MLRLRTWCIVVSVLALGFAGGRIMSPMSLDVRADALASEWGAIEEGESFDKDLLIRSVAGDSLSIAELLMGEVGTTTVAFLFISDACGPIDPILDEWLKTRGDSGLPESRFVLMDARTPLDTLRAIEARHPQISGFQFVLESGFSKMVGLYVPPGIVVLRPSGVVSFIAFGEGALEQYRAYLRNGDRSIEDEV